MYKQLLGLDRDAMIPKGHEQGTLPGAAAPEMTAWKLLEYNSLLQLFTHLVGAQT